MINKALVDEYLYNNWYRTMCNSPTGEQVRERTNGLWYQMSDEDKYFVVTLYARMSGKVEEELSLT